MLSLSPSFDDLQEMEYLLSTAFSVKLSSKKMKKWEKDYLQLQTKGQEDQVELRRLRTENKLLRQRIGTFMNGRTDSRVHFGFKVA